MNMKAVGSGWFVAVMAGLGLAACGARAATVTGSSSVSAYTVSGTDLLQSNLGSFDNAINLYLEEGYYNVAVPGLTDGQFGPTNKVDSCGISGGSVTYLLNTTYYPAGYDIAAVNTYTGWNDTGRVNQKYTVSFRKVGSSAFGDDISVDYAGTDRLTYVNIADVNLTGVDAVRFTFPGQQNGGVGYKEFDVIGTAPALSYVVTSSSSGSAYAVSGTDLLQTHLGATADALALFYEDNYVNGTVTALTDGQSGAANAVGSCAIVGGSVTYTLNMADNPAGYDITAVDSYSGWNDLGRKDQKYTVSFRKVGSAAFGDSINVDYAGSASQTAVNIAGLGLTGVDAVQFSFPGQQSNGVGYKEFDVIGSAASYADVTRLESGAKVIADNAASNVRITEGTGTTPGDITLAAATNTIRSLTQGATAGIATINPAGQALALNGIYLQADAGGLSIGAGTLMAAAGTELSVENRSANDITVDAAIADGRSAASALVKTGAGTLKLNGVNTYSDMTVFGGGVVEVATLSNYGAAGSLGNYSYVRERNTHIGLLFRSGTLRYAGATAQSTDRAIRVNADGGDGFPGGATLDASGSVPSATLSFTAAASPDFFEQSGNRTLTFTGSNTGNNLFAMAIVEIGGATSVAKSGAGTWQLTGANAYSGGTRVEGGTLKSSALGWGSVTVAAGATWDAGVYGQTIAGLSGSGTVTRASGAVTTGADGAALISTNKNYVQLLDFGNAGGATVNGVAFESAGMSGTGWSLSLVGNPEFYLFGENVATNGYDQLTNDFYYNGKPGVLTFTDLTVGQTYVITLYTQVNWWKGRPEDATFTNGSDTRRLINTEPGDVGYYAYRFVANDATATVTMTPRSPDTFHWFAASLETVAAPVALTVGDANDYTFAGVISGPTTLVKQGGGKLTLSGASTYGGATTVSAGTLEITASNALPAGTAVDIATGSVLLLNNAGEQTVAALTFDGVPQYKGTWGGPASNAQHKRELFAGAGVLRVLTGPASPGALLMLF